MRAFELQLKEPVWCVGSPPQLGRSQPRTYNHGSCSSKAVHGAHLRQGDALCRQEQSTSVFSSSHSGPASPAERYRRRSHSSQQRYRLWCCRRAQLQVAGRSLRAAHSASIQLRERWDLECDSAGVLVFCITCTWKPQTAHDIKLGSAELERQGRSAEDGLRFRELKTTKVSNDAPAPYASIKSTERPGQVDKLQPCRSPASMPQGACTVCAQRPPYEPCELPAGSQEACAPHRKAKFTPQRDHETAEASHSTGDQQLLTSSMRYTGIRQGERLITVMACCKACRPQPIGSSEHISCRPQHCARLHAASYARSGSLVGNKGDRCAVPRSVLATTGACQNAQICMSFNRTVLVVDAC